MEAVQEGFESCRGLTDELCPLILYDADLCHAIESLEARLRHQHGLVVNVKAETECSLWDKSVSLLLYRAVRKLLLNVIKHAGVKEAEVRLRLPKEDQIQIVVRDEGQGFDPAHGRQSTP
jgi:signal transduction histidine kinase